MSLHPIRDSIIVSKDQVSEKTEGGLIYKPGNAAETIVIGTVVEVGSGRVTFTGITVPLEVKKGDKVYFDKTVAIELKDSQNSFYLLKEDDVLSIIKD